MDRLGGVEDDAFRVGYGICYMTVSYTVSVTPFHPVLRHCAQLWVHAIVLSVELCVDGTFAQGAKREKCCWLRDFKAVDSSFLNGLMANVADKVDRGIICKGLSFCVGQFVTVPGESGILKIHLPDMSSSVYAWDYTAARSRLVKA